MRQLDVQLQPLDRTPLAILHQSFPTVYKIVNPEVCCVFYRSTPSGRRTAPTSPYLGSTSASWTGSTPSAERLLPQHRSCVSCCCPATLRHSKRPAKMVSAVTIWLAEANCHSGWRQASASLCSPISGKKITARACSCGSGTQRNPSR